MILADLEDVAELDALAFQAERRTQQHLKACLELNPHGCFVATSADGSPVGYVFSRRWGNLGWIGVGGVHPAHQRQGWGKALVSRTIQQLQASGCTTVGGSTQTANNVGIWASLGFVPGAPTLEMVKPAAAAQFPATAMLLSQLDRAQALQAICQISHTVQPGLDYTAEVCNADEYGWGETLLFGWPSPWAFALLRTDPIRPGLAHTLRISVLVMPHEVRQRLPEVLSAIEDLAWEKHYKQLDLFVDTSTPDALQHALKYGFRVRSLWIRMALNQSPPPPSGVDLSLWAM